MAHNQFVVDITGGSCPAPMTRAALIALRNSAGLVKDCDYVVTDHVQGRLVAGTEIHLQAVSASELSENVSVNTTYDNEAWQGIYDLDRALVLELHDNRGNVARGFNGTEVASFDWGNVNITDVTVDNATWSSTIGSPLTVSQVSVLDGSVLTTTGQTGGVLQRVTVERGSTVDTSNASISLINHHISSGSGIFAAGFTGASALNSYRVSNNSFVSVTNSSSGFTLSNVSLDNSSQILHNNVTTGTVTGSNVVLNNNATVTHNNGALNLSLNRVQLTNFGRIFHSQGTISLGDYTIDSQSLVQQITGVGGTINLNTGRMSGSAQISNLGVSTINGTRLYVEAGAVIVANNGAVGTVTLTGTKMFSASQLNITSTATAGNTTITTSTIDNTTIIQRTGVGALTVVDSNISTNSRVTVSADRGLSITRVTATNLAQILQSGTGAVTDVVADSLFDTRGMLQITSSGAAAHNLAYIVGRGLNGQVNITGTSTGQTLQRVKVDGGTVTFTNNVANTFTNVSVIDGSTVLFTGMTVSKGVSNFSANTNSFITVNNPTVAGTLTNVVAYNSGVIDISGTAGVAQTLHAYDGGGINMNGGSSTRVSKQMQGTLTTGNFTHQNVVVVNITSPVLTANNVGRSSYLGVVSTTPLI